MMVGARRSCKGVCSRYKTSAPRNNGGVYKAGFKRCNVCVCYFKTEEYRCPCCKNPLRTKPRNGKYKEPFRTYVTETPTIKTKEVTN